MLTKVIGAGETVTFQSNYVGQFIVLKTLNNTDIKVTQLKVVPLGDGVLCDLDEEGVNIMGTQRLVSTYSNFTNNDFRIVMLADGVIPGKVTDITITNGGTQNLWVYMPVFGRGTTYVRSLMQTVLASSQSVFRDFSFLGIQREGGDSEATQVSVDYEDGGNHVFSISELLYCSAFIQDVQKPVIDNVDGYVTRVNIIPDVDRKVYLQRYDAIGNL